MNIEELKESAVMRSVELEAIEKLIEQKKISRTNALQAYRIEDNDFDELTLQRERLLYNGMIKREYLNYLDKNPTTHEADGVEFKITGFHIWAEFDTEEEEHVYFSDTVYKEHANPRMSFTTKNGRNYINYSHDCPKSRRKLFDKLAAVSKSLKMVEPDISKDY